MEKYVTGTNDIAQLTWEKAILAQISSFESQNNTNIYNSPRRYKLF